MLKREILRSNSICRSICAAMLAGASGFAFAGGTAFDAPSISGLGTSNAGQAAEAGDASVMYSNPAALTRFKRAELTQGAAYIRIGTDYTSNQNNDGAPTNNGTQGSNGQVFSRRDGADAATLAPDLFVAIPLSEKMVMGFSSSASHGLVLHYDENYPGRNQGRDIDFKVIRLNLGLGYKVSPTFSIGANGSYERYYQKILLKLNYRDAVEKLSPGSSGALDTAAAAGLAPPIPQEANAKLRMFGWAFNAQLGALWEPSENTRIGLSYRPESNFDGNSGKFTLEDSADQQAFRNFLRSQQFALLGAATGVDGNQSADDLEPEQRIRQNIKLPDELRLSIFHHATPKLDLMATYTRMDFSVTKLRFERESNGRVLEDVPQNFVVANSYRVGMNYRLYNRLTLKAGYAVENSVIDDATRITVLPDSDRKYYSVGAQFDYSRSTIFHLAYMYLDTDPAPVGNNDGITPPEVTGGDFKGTVQLDTHFFGIGVTERF